jgi:hypothetical protein
VRVINQGPSRRQSFPPSVHGVGELARTAGKSGQVMSKWAEVGRVNMAKAVKSRVHRLRSVVNIAEAVKS